MAYALLGATVTTGCKLPSTRMAYPMAPLTRAGEWKRTLETAEPAAETTWNATAAAAFPRETATQDVTQDVTGKFLS